MGDNADNKSPEVEFPEALEFDKTVAMEQSQPYDKPPQTPEQKMDAEATTNECEQSGDGCTGQVAGAVHSGGLELSTESIESLLSSSYDHQILPSVIKDCQDNEEAVDGDNECEEEEAESPIAFKSMLDSIAVERKKDDSLSAPPTRNNTPEAVMFGRNFRSSTIYDPDRVGNGPGTEVRATDGTYVDREYDAQRERKIKFGEPIVSGSMPPNVYQRPQVLPREQLIKEYKNACEANRTKIFPEIVSNIERAKSLEERVKELSLKGEKVDTRSCDALDIVFKNVQCITLDLEGCFLEDSVAINLFEMIEYYEIATKVRIGCNNKLTQYAWMYLCQLIRKCPFIEILDCTGTEMQDAAAILIARSIRNNCNLVALNLSNCRMRGKYLNYLVVGLRSNYILQELYLGDNMLNDADASLLSQLLKSNFRLQCLDLRNNSLGDRGASLLFDGLKEQSPTSGFGLISLVLWNNNLTSNCSYVIDALAAHRSLETLNMGYNYLRNDGIMNIKEGLMKNKSIVRLGLSSTKFDSIGAIALAEYIAESQSIVRLDIRNNFVRVAGIMALQNALKNNYTLTRLDIDDEPKKEQLQGYAELYHKNAEQIQFLLERNQTLANEEDTRRFVLQQQMVSFRRGLASGSQSQTGVGSPSPTTDQIRGIPIILPPKSDELDSPVALSAPIPLPTPTPTLLSISLEAARDNANTPTSVSTAVSQENTHPAEAKQDSTAVDTGRQVNSILQSNALSTST